MVAINVFRRYYPIMTTKTSNAAPSRTTSLGHSPGPLLRVDDGPRGSTILQLAMETASGTNWDRVQKHLAAAHAEVSPAEQTLTSRPIWIVTPEGTFLLPQAGKLGATRLGALIQAAADLDATPALPPEEAALFDAAGGVEDRAAAAAAMAASGNEYMALVETALDVAQAAALLSLTPARIRQRLNKARTLYGFKDAAGDWRLPSFQFIGTGKARRVLPGVEVVLPHIRPDVRPLEVARFFMHPHPDLEHPTRDETMSPIAWLAGGNSPEALVPLAEEV